LLKILHKYYIYFNLIYIEQYRKIPNAALILYN